MGIGHLPLALIVNPSAGARQRRRSCCPQVEKRARRATSRLPGREDTRPRARRRRGPPRRRGRRDPGGDERRRPDRHRRRSAGRLARCRSGSSPAGAATTSPGSSASPATPSGRVEVLAAGETRQIDVGEANGQRFLGIASVGFDSDANRIANETKLIRGNLVYAYAALRALRRLEAGALHGPGRRGAAALHRLQRGGRQHQGLRRRDVRRSRRRSSPTGSSTSS